MVHSSQWKLLLSFLRLTSGELAQLSFSHSHFLSLSLALALSITHFRCIPLSCFYFQFLSLSISYAILLAFFRFVYVFFSICNRLFGPTRRIRNQLILQLSLAVEHAADGCSHTLIIRTYVCLVAENSTSFEIFNCYCYFPLICCPATSTSSLYALDVFEYCFFAYVQHWLSDFDMFINFVFKTHTHTLTYLKNFILCFLHHQ